MASDSNEMAPKASSPSCDETKDLCFIGKNSLTENYWCLKV